MEYNGNKVLFFVLVKDSLLLTIVNDCLNGIREFVAHFVSYSILENLHTRIFNAMNLL